MSVSLGADLVSSSIDASLAELDSRSRNAGRETETAGDVAVGPFAVLDLTSGAAQDSMQPDERTGAISEDPLPTTSPVEPVAAEEMTTFNPLSSVIDPLAPVDDSLHWPDLLGLDLLEPDPYQLGCLPEMNTDLHFLPDASDANLINESSGVVGCSDAAGIEPDCPTPMNRRQNSPNPHSATVDMDMLSDAPFLLRNFQCKVIPQMMTMPLGEKSPWNILNLPSAMVTYSELTILGSQNLSYAQLANLHSVLACSAILLSLRQHSLDDSVQHWRQVADNMFRLARDNMQMSLKHETQEPKKSKYKDQLMAVCCLTEFAVSLTFRL
jgi:arginine metabolism regulation protein II